MGARLKVTSAVILLAFVAILVRLFYWQILNGQKLSIQARSQYEVGQSVQAPRGNILAADGSWLAARETEYQVVASIPDLKQTPEKIAEKLAPFFVEDNEDKGQIFDETKRLTDLMNKSGAVWVPLKSRVTKDIKTKIEDLGIDGINFENVEARAYPEASTAAHLLGFVGKNEQGENVGYFGLEGYYNLTLSGKPGFISQELDPRGVPILIGDSQEINATGGVDLLTHIDKSIQLTLDQKLKDGIEKYGAKSGTAIIMDPKTGAVLAMSSFPSYDPGKYFDYGNTYFKDPAIADTFEPGSIFKVLVMSAGLDAGVVEPDTKCPVCGGPLKVDKYYINTWNNEYRPDETMTDIIVHSDNVGMSYVGQQLGADKMYDYLSKFGIGKTTGIDLQGEVTAKLREKGTWNIVDLATASFGQGVAVTPIQMAKAVSVIANGGRLVKPEIVDKLVLNGWQEKVQPQVGDRVISEEAANKMTAMMVEAAKHGEAQWAYPKGFDIAGKTGTAQIPIAGHYDATKTNASFVGFAPANDPKFVMIVTLNEPTTSPWAAETAAPLWFSIARDLFMYMGIQPSS